MTDQDADSLIAERCGVLVDNDLGRHQLRWLVAEVGEHGVQHAVSQLAGGRRPYTTNIAKFLGLIAMPKSVPEAEFGRPPARPADEVLAELLLSAEAEFASRKAATERNRRASEVERQAVALRCSRRLEAMRKMVALRASGNVPREEPPQA